MKSPQKQVMKAAIWAAVSSKRQADDDKISIPDQLRMGHVDALFYNMKCPPFFYSRFSILDIDKSLNSAIINIIRY